MLSIIVNGRILDWKFKKMDYGYTFYTGEIYQGQLFKMKKTWSAVSSKPTGIGPVDGFATREDAAEFLLQINGFIERNSLQCDLWPFLVEIVAEGTYYSKYKG